jgi:hypothetical protein
MLNKVQSDIHRSILIVWDANERSELDGWGLNIRFNSRAIDT